MQSIHVMSKSTTTEHGRRLRTTSRSALQRLSGLWVMLAIVVVWQAIVSLGIYPAYAVPSPSRVLSTAWRVLTEKTLFIHIGHSMGRHFFGFLIAILIGLPGGIALGWSTSARNAFQPIVRLINPIPGIAWVPLAILWFGLGNQSIVFAIFITALFPVLINTAAGVSGVPIEYRKVMKVFGTASWHGFRRVILPAALPFILAGIRLGYATGWRVIISAEMIAATSGLGFMIDNARWQLRPDVVIVGMFVIGFVGMLVENFFFDFLENRTLKKWGMLGPS